jgi:hypothetical protein
MLNFLFMTYAFVTSFVLVSAERNRREARPHAPAIVRAGEVTMSASAAFALLLFGWVVLHALGFAPEPALP